MKIKILNDGGYGDMEQVKFPVTVDAEDDGFHYAYVPTSELYRIGATRGCFNDFPEWPFKKGEECEVISE